MNAGSLDDVGNAQVRKTPLSLLEEEDAFVAGSVVVAHADLLLVPDQRLPKSEARRFGDRLRDEHRLRIAEQVEVRVLLEHPVDRLKELREPGVREYREPVQLLDALLCLRRVVVPTARCFSSDSHGGSVTTRQRGETGAR